MSSYTITIAPDDPTRATTTLRVESTAAGTRITELLVRAGENTGLAAGQLPTIDLDRLLQAVTSTTSAPVAMTTAAPIVPPTPAGPTTTGAAAVGKATTSAATPSARADASARVTRTTGKTTAAASASGERRYRRSPQDLAQVYQQAGTVTAVADHYGVPRYTAQSWIRTLRRNDSGSPRRM